MHSGRTRRCCPSFHMIPPSRPTSTAPGRFKYILMFLTIESLPNGLPSIWRKSFKYVIFFQEECSHVVKLLKHRNKWYIDKSPVMRRKMDITAIPTIKIPNDVILSCLPAYGIISATEFTINHTKHTNSVIKYSRKPARLNSPTQLLIQGQ